MENKFFQIKNSIMDDVNNIYPQVVGLSINPEYSIVPNQSKLLSDRFLDEKIIFPIFHLDEKTFFTDFISCGSVGGYGFLISERLKEILCKFNIPKSKYYNVFVEKNGLIKKYYWIQLLSSNENINFVKSLFYKIDFDDEIIEDNKIYDNVDELNFDRKMMDDFEYIKFSNLVLRNADIDMFVFQNFLGEKYISERLYAALLSNDITGFQAVLTELITVS